jgi:hypothetical protein
MTMKKNIKWSFQPAQWLSSAEVLAGTARGETGGKGGGGQVRLSNVDTSELAGF